MLRLPRIICVLLGLHHVAGFLVRRTDGSVRMVAQCPTCHAAA
jgi:hypothetical protein